MGLFSCFSGSKTGTSSPKAKAHEGSRKAQYLPQEEKCPVNDAISGSEDDLALPSIPPRSTSPARTKDREPQSPVALHRDANSGKDVVVARSIDQSADGAQSARSPRPFVSTPPTSMYAVLLPFTDEISEAPLHHYLSTIGKLSGGLIEGVQDNPDVGNVFGASYRLHKTAASVVVNSENAAMLAALGQDVVRALDLAGRRGSLGAMSLDGLALLLRDSCGLVGVYGMDGWLLHMACNDHIKADFDSQHNAIIDAMERMSLEVPGKPFPLSRGFYLDVNRNLRRCLKRMGSGSVAQGLKTAKSRQSLDDALELSSQLGVGAEAVIRELAGLPADVPLDSFYSRIVAREGRPLGLEQCKSIFDTYDKEGLGYLDRNGLRAVLTDLGALEGLRATELEAAVSRAFILADSDSTGRITAEEFARYFDALTCKDAIKQLRLALGPAAESELKQFFSDFCSFGTRQVVEEMDNVHFAKFCKDCNLLGKDLTVTDIDLAFARAKPKGSRKVSFEGFMTALAECAERKGVSLEVLVRSVLSSEGPVVRATKADAVRLHDDKSTYTGVYAKGGPKVCDVGHDLAALLDRSDATRRTARGPRPTAFVLETKVPEKPQSPLLQPSTGLNTASGTSPNSNSASKRRSTIGGVPSRSKLQDMWLMWANFGAGSNSTTNMNTHSQNSHHVHGPSPSPGPRPEMGVTQFIKLVRETGLLDRAFTAVQAELIFVRVKAKDSTKLTYEAFEKAMRLIAEAKGVSLDDVEGAVVKSRGPMLTARQQ